MIPLLSPADTLRVEDAVDRASVPGRRDDIVGGIARDAARLCQTRLAGISLLARRRNQLDVRGTFGPGGRVGERRLSLAHSLNGQVILSGRSFRSADVSRDERSEVREIGRRYHVRSVLIAPLGDRRGPWGTLAIARRTTWEFSERDQSVLEEFARRASTLLEDDEMVGRRAMNAASAGSASAVHLTPRERDIIALLAADHSCGEVASALELSSHTVRHYVERLKLRFRRSTLHGLVSLLAPHL
jgi:DNA-binding CsgD family transcriptional regulator